MKTKKLNPKTEEIIKAIEKTFEHTAQIHPSTFTWAFGRSNVPAAFRAALERGIIERDCKNIEGTWLYKKAGN